MGPAANRQSVLIIGLVAMRPRTQSQTLTNSDNDTTGDKDSDIAPGSKALHKGSDDDCDSTRRHADTTASIVGKRTSHEPTGNYGSDGISSVDGTDGLSVLILSASHHGLVIDCRSYWVVKVSHPVLGTLQGIEDRGIVSVKNHT